VGQESTRRTHSTFYLTHLFTVFHKGPYDFISNNSQNVLRSPSKFKRYMKFGRTKFLEELRKRAQYVLGPTLGAALIVYVTYHALQGERGLIAFWQLHGQVMHAQHIHDRLRITKKRLQNRVKLLNPNSLDTDMLEERVRFMLGYSRPDETIILKR